MFESAVLFILGWILLPRPAWSKRLQEFITMWFVEKFG